MTYSHLVRIELHDAQWSHYEVLHVQMERAGFKRTITSDTGSIHHLPHATYVAQFTNADANAAYDVASAAAAQTGRSFDLIVADYKTAKWSLQLVTASRLAA